MEATARVSVLWSKVPTCPVQHNTWETSKPIASAGVGHDVEDLNGCVGVLLNHKTWQSEEHEGLALHFSPFLKSGSSHLSIMYRREAPERAAIATSMKVQPYTLRTAEITLQPTIGNFVYVWRPPKDRRASLSDGWIDLDLWIKPHAGCTAEALWSSSVGDRTMKSTPSPSEMQW